MVNQQVDLDLVLMEWQIPKDQELQLDKNLLMDKLIDFLNSKDKDLHMEEIMEQTQEQEDNLDIQVVKVDKLEALELELE